MAELRARQGDLLEPEGEALSRGNSNVEGQREYAMNPAALTLELRFVDYPTSGSHARGFGTEVSGVEVVVRGPGSGGAGGALM